MWWTFDTYCPHLDLTLSCCAWMHSHAFNCYRHHCGLLQDASFTYNLLVDFVTYVHAGWCCLHDICFHFNALFSPTLFCRDVLCGTSHIDACIICHHALLCCPIVFQGNTCLALLLSYLPDCLCLIDVSCINLLNCEFLVFKLCFICCIRVCFLCCLCSLGVSCFLCSCCGSRCLSLFCVVVLLLLHACACCVCFVIVADYVASPFFSS